MKRLLPLSGLLLLATAATAQFTGSDDFAGAAKNTSKWGADIQNGDGLLTQSGGVLRFSSASGTGDNEMMWPWLPGNAPFGSSWSIQADVHVPVITLADGFTAVGIGIGVRSTADSTDSFEVNMENVRSPGEAQEHNFYNSLKIDDATTETSVPAPAVLGAVRLSWNAATQALTAQYDADGAANGYGWTVFQSFNPVAEGWNMTSGDSFEIFIRGYAEDTAVTTAQNVHLDNFLVSADAPANLNGGDNFNDNARDVGKWGADEGEGNTGLTETDQRLEYTTTGVAEGWTSRRWIANSGSYVENWETWMDVHVANVALPADEDDLRIVLEVYGGDHVAGVQLELKNEGFLTRRFRWEHESEEGHGEGGGSAATTSTDAAVRVAFDAATKELSFYYDENGSVDGYAWTAFGALDVDAVATNWGLDVSSRFIIAVAGESEGIAVNPGDAFADNFNAFSVIPPPIAGGFSGFDDFAGAAKNALKWGPDASEGSGQLSQTGDGVLRFLSADTGDDNFMVWPWLVDGPFATSWSIQADVHVPYIPLSDEGYAAVGMGIAVGNSANPDHFFSAGLENFKNPADSQRFHFLNAIDITGDDTLETYAAAAASHGAVRIAWDAAAKTLTAFYDADGPANGYSWTAFKTFNPAADGWEMTAANKFNIYIGGWAELTQVNLPHNVYADNFYTFGVTSGPVVIVAPAAKTLPATAINFEGATLNGTVNAKGSARAVTFEYGTTTSYGSTVTATPATVDGTTDMPVSATVTGLLPHTKYNFRVRAAGEAGAAHGANMTFTTGNRHPIAQTDEVTALPGSVVIVPALDNDTDPDGDALTLASFTQPPAASGKVTKQGNMLVFTAAGAFNTFTDGTSFTYAVKDAFGGSAQGTVNLLLGSCEIDPTAVTLPSAAVTYDVTVTATGAWSVAESLSWVTAGITGGTDGGVVPIQVMANTGKTERNGIVLIGGQPHSITQAPAQQPPVLTMPPSVPDGIVSGYYELAIPTTEFPVKYTITKGPPGLTIDGNLGVLSGKPSKAGTYEVVIKAANAAGSAAPISFTIIIHPLPAGLIGSFSGFIEPNETLNGDLGSRLEVTSTLTGAVSGKLITGTTSLPFKGQLDAALGETSASLLLPIVRKSGAFLALDVELDGAARSISGELLEKGFGATPASAWENTWNRAGAR